MSLAQVLPFSGGCEELLHFLCEMEMENARWNFSPFFFLDCLSSLQDNKDIIITWCGDLKVLFHFQLCAGFHQYSLFWVDVAHREVIMVDYTSVLIGHYMKGQRPSLACFFLHRSQRSRYALHYLSHNYICTFTNLIAILNGDVLVV